MSKAAISPLRWITPSQLMICLILFFLPWVEIQCQRPKDFNFNNQNPKLDSKDLVWAPFIRQSGLQVATGQYSFADSEMRDAMEKMEKMGNKKDKEKQEKEKVDAAPILWVFLVAIVVGILVGFILPSSPMKKGVLIACCLLALGVAGGQAIIGFPITKNSKEQTKEKNNPQMDMGEVVRTSLKIPYFLTLLFCAGAIVTTILEPVRKPPKKRIVVVDVDDDLDDPQPE